jgi:hypothetical protein
LLTTSTDQRVWRCIQTNRVARPYDMSNHPGGNQASHAGLVRLSDAVRVLVVLTETLLPGHPTSSLVVTAAPSAAHVLAPPTSSRRAPPTGGRGCVALCAAAPRLPTGASTGRRRSTSTRSPGPIHQLTVAGVRVHFPRNSTAPHASAAQFKDGGGRGGGEDGDRGAATAPTSSPLDGPDEASSKKGRATQGATKTGPSY